MVWLFAKLRITCVSRILFRHEYQLEELNLRIAALEAEAVTRKDDGK